MSIRGGVDREALRTDHGLSATTRKEALPSTARGDALEGIILSDTSQRNTNTVGSCIYVESFLKKKIKDAQNRLVVARGGGGAGWVMEVFRLPVRRERCHWDVRCCLATAVNNVVSHV